MSQASQFGEWRPMASAPRDGTRLLVAIRASEQGAAEVDVARWGRAERGGDERWVASDSDYEAPIFYEEHELTFWMPLPKTVPAPTVPDLRARAPKPPPSDELGGSGI